MDLPPLHVAHPDDERFDEIHIYVQERWKESELSGDEWRFSYVAEIKRKGETVIRLSASRLGWLLEGLSWRMITAGENGKVDEEAYKRTKDKCDQPGCTNVATLWYSRIKSYSSQGELLANHRDSYRQFCEYHKNRGDCALDDAEHNYIRIEKPTN